MARGSTDAVRRFSDWYFDRTLPHWRHHVIDQNVGGFHEALDKSGAGTSNGGKRTMVQARLCFVFAHAFQKHGNPADLAAAQGGFEFLSSHCRHPDGGWFHKLTEDGAPLDQDRDLYDHAFILFATAWLDRAGVELARETAETTQSFLDAEMAHPEGGFIEQAGRATLPRRQNPHMHLLEACLAWYETSNENIWLDRAARIVSLFNEAFVVDGSLREYFSENWQPMAGDSGRLIEPGHHFEWVWLLHRYAKLTGQQSEHMRSLYNFACAHGVDKVSGGVVDVISADGTLLSPNHRLWPQTEAIKAHNVYRKSGDKDAGKRLDATLNAFWQNHLKDEPNGVWREHIGPDGKRLRDDMPGSSPYHLAMAVGEILDEPDA